MRCDRIKLSAAGSTFTHHVIIIVEYGGVANTSNMHYRDWLHDGWSHLHAFLSTVNSRI